MKQTKIHHKSTLELSNKPDNKSCGKDHQLFKHQSLEQIHNLNIPTVEKTNEPSH